MIKYLRVLLSLFFLVLFVHFSASAQITDLGITKAVDNPTPNVGSNVIFTVTVINNGPDVAHNIIIQDIPGDPTAYTLVSATGGTFDIGTGQWLIPSLASGASMMAQITATVNGNKADYSNTVTVTGDETDNTPGNNSSTVTPVPVLQSDIGLTKTVDNGTPNVNTNVIFTITAKNNGPSDAFGVTVTDQLPAGYTYVSSAPDAGTTYDNTTGLWTIGNMPTGTSSVLTITGTVKPNQTGFYDNTASVTHSNQADPTPGNNTAHVSTTPVQLTDLVVTKTVDNATPNVGSTVTFTITATNNGPSNATGVQVQDTPGATGAYTYTSVTPGTFDTGTGVWTIGNLASGASVTSTVVATVNGNQPDYSNTVTITGNETDPTPGDNSSTVTPIPVLQSDIGLTKTVDNGTPNVNTNVIFTITAKNNGPSDAFGVTVTDQLPAGYTYVSSAPDAGTTYDNTTGLWTIGNMPTGTSSVLTITGTVKPNQTGFYDNTASVTHSNQADPTPGNNTADVSTTPVPVADLGITNTDGQATYSPGVANTYTILVSNAGPSDVVNAKVSVTLPGGATGGSWSTSGTAGTNPHNATGTGSITNELVDIPSGGSITYTYTVTPGSSTSAGNFALAASVAAPVGTTDGNSANDSATDTDIPATDLSITNTDGTTIYTPGTTNNYTVIVTNTGTDVTGAIVTFPFPTGVTGTWSASLGAGATGTTSGTGSINETVNIPSGSSITYTITANIASNVTTNPLATTATVTAPVTVSDTNTGNNSITDNDTFTPVADLQITANTDGITTYTPGTTHTYTVTATNAGTTDAPGSTVTYPMPAGVTGSWTAAYSGGATGNASGTNSINETVNLPSGGTVTYTVTANIASSVTANPLALTATVTVPTGFTDPTPLNNTSTDNDTFTPVADLQITANTDGITTYTPGTTHTYTVTATNAGTTDAPGSTVTYPMPTGVTGTWTAAYSGGASGTASGTGSINETVNLPSGGTVTYTVTANIASSVTTDPLALIATVTVPTGFTDPTPLNNTSTDNDTFTPVADLQITANTDGTTTYTPGTTHTYTVTATNAGTTDAPGSIVTYPIPTGVTGTWTAAYSGGATGNASGTNSINETVNLPSGGTVTYTVTANIASSVTANPLALIATVTVPTGFTDSAPGNNSITDNDTFTPVADLQITANTDGITTYTPGTTHTYTVTATNAGTTDAPGSIVTYPIPTGVTGTWTAAYSGGATGNASGTNSINETVNLPSGGTVTYTVTANIASSVTANPLALTATVTVPTGFTDPTPLNNTSTDNDTFTPVADLQITANTDGITTYTPGTTHTYTVTATNAGTTDAPGSTVTYPMPTGVTGTWTAAYSGGASGTASGTGSINETVNLPSGGTVTYTVTANIASSVTTDPLALIATVTVPTGFTDPTPLNNTSTDNDTFTPVADLQITANTDGTTTYTPGTTHTYTVTATNAGTTDAPGSIVTYPIPTGVTGTWTAAYSGGATGNASGTNSINETVNLPSGGTVTYTVTANIASSVTANPLALTATVTVPTGFTDPTPLNNTSTDNDTFTPVADLQITANTDGKTTYTPGTTNTYTVIVTNAGPTNATGATVTNPMPTGTTGTWTAVFAGGATGTASGTGNINEPVNIPSAGSITYTIVVTVPSSVTGSLTNIATATVPTGYTDPTPANNSVSDVDSQNSSTDLSITKTVDNAAPNVGTNVTFTLTATNNGPSDATGVNVSDLLPAGYTFVSSVAASGTTYTNGTGVWAIGTMGSTSSKTLTITATVVANNIGNYANIATISGNETDPTPANNTATSTPVPVQLADIAVTKTVDNATPNVGANVTFTVTATNNGLSDATNVAITDLLPAGYTFVSSIVTTGAYVSGTGVWTIPAITHSAAQVLTVTATVKPDQTGFYDNTATVTISDQADPNTANNTAHIATTPHPVSDASIVVTDGKTNYTPGTTNTYTVTVTNNGPSNIVGGTVNNTFPAGGTTALWTTTLTGGATVTDATGTGSITNEIVNIPVGGSITYTYTITVPSATTGAYSNTATITLPASYGADPNTANNTSTDIDNYTPVADLAITNTDSKTTYTPGTTNTYTITVTNAGPTDATGATVTNPMPAGTTGTWTAVFTGGATGTANGTGDILQTVNIPSSGTITYTIIITVPSNVTGSLTNTATVTVPTGYTDPTPANNTATDVDTYTPIADLTVANTDGKATYTPGTTNTYTVSVTNAGPTNATGATVTNPMPTGTTGTWAATFTGGATGTANGTGDINQIVNIPAGGTINYTITVTIPASVTSSLTSTATVAIPAGYTDPTPANNTATDVDTYNPVADLQITNTDGSATYTPGTTTTYTVTVTNVGPTNATGATVSNPMPAGVIGTWAAVFTGGATGTANGSGDINQTVNMPAGSTITYTITTAVASTVTGNLVSTATVAVPTGFTDPTLANNTASDSDTQNSVNDLQIVKAVSGTTPSINTQVTFTLTVTNNGPSAAAGVNVTDLLPAGFTYVSSTPSTGSYVNNTGVWTIGNLANSGTATLTVVATVNATGNYTNTATVTASGTDPTPANNSSQVTITAEALPVANNDAGTTIPATAVVIDLLANDVNGYGALVPSSVTVVAQPAHGTVVINTTTGKATYTPTAGYSGTDVFTYTVKDSNGGTSNVATVNLTINKPPVANNDAASTTVNVPVVINILSNDVQGTSNLNTSSVTIVQQPQHGTVSINLSTGAATYTSVTNYFGTDAFTYTVSGTDGAVSNAATVNITITDNPIIGLAKFVLSADKQVNGSFNVTYMLTVQNFGLTALSSLSITDNLSQTFAGENISVVNIKSLGSLVVNPAYNGNTITEMLQSGNALAVGGMQQIQVTVNVALVSTGTATYQNSATATGTSVTGLKTTDISTDGIKPDPNTPGDVSPSIPTPIKLTKPNEYIPGGFSPNNDGVNDNFVIENAGSRRMDLQVFNRWGNVVYHSTDYKNDWQGISNQGLVIGGSVPDGTYFYVVSFDNTDRREGFITIHR